METSMDEINIRVGLQIRRYRKAARWTLQQLADAIHKSRATVCKYERGRSRRMSAPWGTSAGRCRCRFPSW